MSIADHPWFRSYPVHYRNIVQHWELPKSAAACAGISMLTAWRSPSLAVTRTWAQA
ncbi:hypothetical protein H4W32_002738 [Actinophytocola algeriensis]|uniref:Uncharacterized protein n=1 Tax=Actinophytocola algeriensis TaxID=1768010 RepID=A0A7W7Q8B6_9PSEU|nr:hypothetical protein [Actinophytocola algeriensis]MBE1474696.1 hypothetical protein [Actinophytocola algeriensis]